MIAPIGHAATLVALGVCSVACAVAPWVALHPSLAGLRLLRRLSHTFFTAMLAANALMAFALLRHDFSVSYVAQVGSRATPTWVTIVSLWSSLEGSILFWGLLLGVALSLFAWGCRNESPRLQAWALTILFVIAAFFSLLVAGPANPFRTVVDIPADGPGPNPLLQNHVLMAIHPPLLYLGYVGMAVPFAMATAALLAGALPANWLKLMRYAMLWPWTFLSVGIVLGSWWAYEVLGWGGFWAWDPVENASFLPWLTATGFLHATVVQERRRIFRAWTLTLVQASFLLTLLGTFMTRSGVFNSVHAFTQSAIGPLFLGFLGVMLFLSLGLLGGRSHLLAAPDRPLAPLSRETAFLFNNLVLVALTFTVLLGTTFPLVAEGLTGVKLSVGEPYFDRMAAPLGLMLVFLMGVGPNLPWGETSTKRLLARLALPGLIAAVVFLGLTYVAAGGVMTRVTFALCALAVITSLRELTEPTQRRSKRLGQMWPVALLGTLKTQPRRTGGAIVHLAILIIAAGICGAQSFRQTQEAQLKRGDAMTIGRYTLTYQGAQGVEENHRFAAVAHLQLKQDGRVLGGMVPRLNFYPSQREPIGTPHVVTLGRDDVYVSLMSLAPNGEHVVIKVFVIPLVSWLWRSLPLLILGSLISLWPRRLSALRAQASANKKGAKEGLPGTASGDSGASNLLGPTGLKNEVQS